MIEITVVIVILCLIIATYIYYYYVRDNELRLHLFSEHDFEGDDFMIHFQTMPNVLVVRMNEDREVKHDLPSDTEYVDVPNNIISEVNALTLDGLFIRRIIRTDIVYEDEPDEYNVIYGTLPHKSPRLKAPIDYMVFYFK